MTASAAAPKDPLSTGRVNQKKRTRDAITHAAAQLIRTGREVTMLEIAKSALVSEATAYRYFPDLASLLQEVIDGNMPDPAEALAGLEHPDDPVERVGAAAEFNLRLVLARQGAVRAMIAATVARPGGPIRRPGLRLGLIDHALVPLEPTVGKRAPAAFAQLKLGLAVVVGAESLFSLMDLHGLAPDAAIASLVETAKTLTRAAMEQHAAGD